MRLVDHVRLTPCTKSKIPARVTAQSGFYTMADGTTKVAYQSALECDFVKICDFANEVQLVHWEPFSIRLDDLIDRRERIYTPDYLVETIDDEGHRNTLIVEVKPQKEIRAIWQRDPTGSAARAYKAMLEWLYGKPRHRFLLICEDAMAQQGLPNIKAVEKGLQSCDRLAEFTLFPGRLRATRCQSQAAQQASGVRRETR